MGYDREEISVNRWYLLDTEISEQFGGYWCLCYEGDHLVERVPFRERMSAVEYGDSWLHIE